MAKYKRRPKVKRYRRSFYSRGMRIRKIVGIVVLVAVVLAAAWFAAPHVLDWATHTWYTVVKDRDLEAESASRAAASSQAAASAAASEAASSARPGRCPEAGTLLHQAPQPPGSAQAQTCTGPATPPVHAAGPLCSSRRRPAPRPASCFLI